MPTRRAAPARPTSPRSATARPDPADAPTASHDLAGLQAKALLVHERLCAEYGCPIAYFHDLDPLSELVSSLLSHRTRNADSGRAFRALRTRYPSWAALRDAPVAEVEATIAGVTWPEQKAPRLQAVLRAVTERTGALHAASLDFLGELPVPEARAWLEQIPGVGPKTSAAVLSFSRLRRPALPVDSHHHRVAQRLALIGPQVDVGPSHALLAALLPPDWDAQQVYDHHEALMLHGQRVCHWREPACGRCVVLDLCPTGQARMGQPADLPADGERVVARTVAPAADRPVAAAPADPAAPERGLPPQPAPPRAPAGPGRGGASLTRTARRREPQEQRMSTHDHGGRDGRQDPAQEIARMDAEVRAQDARSANPKASGDVNDPAHYQDGQAERAHGTHGKGFSDERLLDAQAVDTGDDPQLRRAGGGGDQAPDPNRMRENSEGRMGGPGWGNEQAGGSSVDRRPRDGSA